MLSKNNIRFIPATLNNRAWAFNIDCLVIGLISIPFLRDKMPDLSALMPDTSALLKADDLNVIAKNLTEPFQGIMIISIIISIIYFSISEILSHGSTLGKRLMKIKTIDINDPASSPSALQTLIRSSLKCITAFYCIDITNITICALSSTNFFFGLISATGSFGYDMISRTVVVKYDYYECCPVEKNHNNAD
ncbi:MAG: RDD family protein [Puniceicoccales bacterium]|jgi:uncharacterized RDD family membrane protein YckC|nr:RDD family protein [Puniceicoccales bacterium]